MRFFIVTVLYNHELTVCETWKSLLRKACGREDCRVVAVENSTDETIRAANRQTAEETGKILYLDMQGNAGLPAAYNRAVNTIWQNPADGEEPAGDGDWIVMTDQDTTFPENYLTAVAHAAASTEAGLLAPVVKGNGVVISPCIQNSSLRFLPGGPEEKTGSGRHYFINSGLAIRGRIFFREGIRYNEDLFLDFTDFDLENQIRARGREKTAILKNVVLTQRFSGTEERTAQQDLERYRRYVHDGTVFYNKWHPGSSRPRVLLKGRGLKLAWKHKDRRFLKKF